MLTHRRRVPPRLFPVLAALTLLASVSCGSPTGDDGTQVALHRAQWEAHGITSYQVDYLVTGFFIAWEGRHIRIVVRGDTVNAATFVDTGEPADSLTTWPTIDELFDRAERAAADGVLRDVRFDPRFDYPSEIDLAGPPDASGSLVVTQLQPHAQLRFSVLQLQYPAAADGPDVVETYERQ